MPDTGLFSDHSASTTDPAIAAYRAFTQAHDALDNCSDDAAENDSGAAHQAYKALVAAKATSAAGVMAQLQGHLRWCNEEGNEEYEALCQIVGDLARFVPVAEEVDSLFSIGTDVETVVGKIECLAALLGRLADDGGDDALLFFSLMYSAQAIRDEAKAAFNRLHAKACAERARAQVVQS